MKNKAILAAGIAAISLVHTASAATTVVRITGSSAFRTAASNAILNVLGAAGNTLTGYAYDTGAGTATSANFQVFQGTVGGNAVIIKTNWSGSVEGIRDVSQQNQIKFLDDATPVSPGGTSGANTFVTNEIPAACLADCRQNSTPYTTTTLTGGAGTPVGIVPFGFVASKSTPASVTNLTAAALRQILTAGYVRQTYLDGTGSQAIVRAPGRYFGSGTRLTALAETGFGTQNLVVQLHPTAFDANNKVTTVNAYTDPNDPDNVGNFGETSGGSLADIMRYDSSVTMTDASGLTPNGQTGFFVTYLGENDSYRACFQAFASNNTTNTGNAKYLTYNGVAGFSGTAYKNQTAAVDGSTATILVTGDVTGAGIGQIVTGNGIAPGSTIIAPAPSFNAGTGKTTVNLDKVTTTAGNPTNVQIGALIPAVFRNGAYTFWNFEQFLWLNSAVPSGTALNTVTAIRDRVRNFDYGFSGLADDTAFKVTRDADGAPVKPNGR